jgi:acetyltransferase-like isoleucine patch superfamily enzyme
MNIFEKMLFGGLIETTTDEFSKVYEIVNETIAASVQLNSSSNTVEIRDRLSAIIGKTIDQSTSVFTPFHTNFGKHITIGNHVFINHGCSFLDLGGITIVGGVPAKFIKTI